MSQKSNQHNNRTSGPLWKNVKNKVYQSVLHYAEVKQSDWLRIASFNQSECIIWAQNDNTMLKFVLTSAPCSTLPTYIVVICEAKASLPNVCNKTTTATTTGSPECVRSLEASRETYFILLLFSVVIPSSVRREYWVTSYAELDSLHPRHPINRIKRFVKRPPYVCSTLKKYQSKMAQDVVVFTYPYTYFSLRRLRLRQCYCSNW